MRTRMTSNKIHKINNCELINVNNNYFKDVRPIIFGYLNAHNQMTCRTVCKVWEEQITKTLLWIQLAQEMGIEISQGHRVNQVDRNQLAKQRVIAQAKMLESFPKGLIDALGGEIGVLLLPRMNFYGRKIPLGSVATQ